MEFAESLVAESLQKSAQLYSSLEASTLGRFMREIKSAGRRQAQAASVADGDQKPLLAAAAAAPAAGGGGGDREARCTAEMWIDLGVVQAPAVEPVNMRTATIRLEVCQKKSVCTP